MTADGHPQMIIRRWTQMVIRRCAQMGRAGRPVAGREAA